MPSTVGVLMSSRTLRVLYSFPHPLGGPGINNTAWQQVAGLANAGTPVTVYTTSLRVPLPESVRVVQTLSFAGRRVPHRALGVRRAYAYHDRRVAHALRSEAAHHDLVHCWPGSCLSTIVAAHRLGLPVFREAPNAHTTTTFEDAARAGASVGVELPRGASHRPDARRERGEEREFATADFVLAPSDYVRQSFLDRGVPADKLLQHHYGYDDTRFTGVRSAEPRPFTAVFIGRGEPAKGLHLALRAWREAGLSTRGRLLVAGRLLPAYERYLAEDLADPSVEVLDFVDDVPGLLGRSDVLLLPSYTEGSALVTYEAMASGAVPLVSTASGAPVRDGVDGLLHEPGDVAVLAGHLRELADDPARLAALRDASLAAARTLTWRDAAARLLDCYERGLHRL